MMNHGRPPLRIAVVGAGIGGLTAAAALRHEWARGGDRSPDALRWLYGFDATALPNA